MLSWPAGRAQHGTAVRLGVAKCVLTERNAPKGPGITKQNCLAAQEIVENWWTESKGVHASPALLLS